MRTDDIGYSLVIESPLGRLGVVLTGEAVCRIDYLPETVPLKSSDTTLALQLLGELDGYFSDATRRFSVPLALEGSAFQLRVWSALQTIPAGCARTYGWLAGELGSGPRAVGNACRHNPVPVIIPCHRVVAAGAMGGYAGKTGDRQIWRKHWLLAHEGADCGGLKKDGSSPYAGTQQTKLRTIHA